MQPLIGIPCSTNVQANGIRRHGSSQTLIDSVIAGGGLPILIPALAETDVLRNIYARLDGLLLGGGPDIDPKYFGEEVDGSEMDSVDELRDAAEVQLVRWAYADDLPILGICRGHQVLHVALGGSLYQDIESSINTTIDHRASTHANQRDLRAHSVRIEPGSRLAELLLNHPDHPTEAHHMRVNTLHHQAVKHPAQNFVVTARADDSVIEASEDPTHRFVMSVQWHPEDLQYTDADSQRLFAAFVQAAQKA